MSTDKSYHPSDVFCVECHRDLRATDSSIHAGFEWEVPGADESFNWFRQVYHDLPAPPFILRVCWPCLLKAMGVSTLALAQINKTQQEKETP